MTPEQIRRAIENADGPPVAALRSAVAAADALVPAVLTVIEKAIAGVHLTPAQDNLLFHGIHVLAAARCKALFQPLLRLLHLPSDRVDELLGDATTASLPGILISTFDGDAASLRAAIEAPALDDMVRCALMGALARVTFDGAAPFAETLALVDRFYHERLAGDGELVWMGWHDMIRLLALADRGELVRASWRDGRAHYCSEQDRAEWEEGFAAACADPENAKRFADDRLEPIDDPADALAWVQPVEDRQPLGPGDGPRQRDPAEAIALRRGEVDWLREFFRSGHMPAEPVSLEALDGFLSALAVGPKLVAHDEAMRELCGGTASRVRATTVPSRRPMSRRWSAATGRQSPAV